MAHDHLDPTATPATPGSGASATPGSGASTQGASAAAASEATGTPQVLVHPDAATLAQAAAARLVTRLVDLQSVHTPVHVALTGGSLGIATLAALKDSPAAAAVDWSSVHLWWGDERFLPAGHPDRNETQARQAWLDAVPAYPEANIHPVPALDEQDVPSAEASAALYARELAAHAPDAQRDQARVGAPLFDIVLLGMGPDAHVASLFPGHPALETHGVAAVAVHDSPKPPADRVSLTFDALRQAAEVWLIVAGADKADAVRRALGGADVQVAPAAGARGRERTLWLIDAQASTAAAGPDEDVAQG